MNNFIYNQQQILDIPVNGIQLKGNIYLPKDTKELIIFAHGSGSSRLSPRNQKVANMLNQEKLGTLLFDLLTKEEEVIDISTAEFRFNIPLLAERLVGVTDWICNQLEFKTLKIGYFGASTGAAAALIAAAERFKVVHAVVSRGGRPDLAKEKLSQVKAPTLLIVGELDTVVIELNQKAQSQMKVLNKLEIVPNATHLFEEPGTLDKVIRLAYNWFKQYLNFPNE